MSEANHSNHSPSASTASNDQDIARVNALAKEQAALGQCIQSPLLVIVDSDNILLKQWMKWKEKEVAEPLKLKTAPKRLKL